MSTAVPEFDHVKEYARYGGIIPGNLQKRVASMYPGTLEVIVADDDIQAFNTVSRYKTRVRGFLWHHGFRMESSDKKILKAQHIISASALKKLESIIGNGAQDIPEFYGMLAHFMNHDMLHGFNGAGENFTEFDEQLIFGGVEFFPLMAHSEIFERWMRRDANGDFVLNLGRTYINTLAPLAAEYEKTKDPEIRRLIDYFVLIYQKCLLTVLPLQNEVALKFNGGVRRMLYPDLPQCEMMRLKCESILDAGLEKGGTKNNLTLLSNPLYDKRQTGAAKAGVKLLDTVFDDGQETERVDHIMKMTIENLITGGAFRMVANMDRPSNLQKKFQRIYMK